MNVIERLTNYIIVLCKVDLAKEKEEFLTIEDKEGYLHYKYLERKGFIIDPKMRELLEKGVIIQDEILKTYEELAEIESKENFHNLRYVLYEYCREQKNEFVLDEALDFCKGTINSFWKEGECLTTEQFEKICKYLKIEKIAPIMEWSSFFY